MNKKIYISLAVILALTAYIIISKNSGSRGIVKLPDWKGQASAISVSGPNVKYTILNEKDKWVIGADKFPADSAAVNDIEKKFKEIEITDQISEGEYYEKYDLTPDKYFEITIVKDKSQVRKIFIGKKGATQHHTYVRIGGLPGVFLADGTFESITAKSLNDLRDKDVLKLDPDLVESINIAYKGKLFSLKKETSEQKAEIQPDKKNEKKGSDDATPPPQKIVNWFYAGDPKNPLSKNKIDQLIALMNPLKAIDFPVIDKSSLKNPVCEIKIYAEKKEIFLKIFEKEKDKNHYPAISSESPYVFLMDEWKTKKLFIDKIEDLKDK